MQINRTAFINVMLLLMQQHFSLKKREKKIKYCIIVVHQQIWGMVTVSCNSNQTFLHTKTVTSVNCSHQKTWKTHIKRPHTPTYNSAHLYKQKHSICEKLIITNSTLPLTKYINIIKTKYRRQKITFKASIMNQ